MGGERNLLGYVGWVLNRENLIRKCFVWKGKVDWETCLLNMSWDVSICEGMEQYGDMSLYANERVFINVSTPIDRLRSLELCMEYRCIANFGRQQMSLILLK